MNTRAWVVRAVSHDIADCQINMLSRSDPSLACDVKMAWQLKRAKLGGDEATPTPGSRALWSCTLCRTFPPAANEHEAWAHVLDTVRFRLRASTS